MQNKPLLRTTKLGADGMVYYLEVHRYKLTYSYKILPAFNHAEPTLRSFDMLESGTLDNATEDYHAMQLGELKLEQFLKTLTA